MSEQTMPQVGDVIISKKFAYGYYDGKDKRVVTIDGKTKNYPMIFHLTENERIAIAVRTGETPPVCVEIELGAYDSSRAFARFVVESAGMEGGSRDEGYPDGWSVSARRLDEDGSYNPDGELIHFFMSGCFTCKVEPQDVEIVDKMQRQVTFV